MGNKLADHGCLPSKDAKVEKSTNKELILILRREQFYYKPQFIQIISTTFNGEIFQDVIIDEKKIPTETDDFSLKITIDINKKTEFQNYLEERIKNQQYNYDIWIAGWYYATDGGKKLEVLFKQQNQCYFKQTIPLNLEKADSKPKENCFSLIYFTPKELALHFDWAAFGKYKPNSLKVNIRVQQQEYELGEMPANQACAKFDLTTKKMQDDLVKAILTDSATHWELKYYGKFGDFEGEPRSQMIPLTKEKNHPYKIDFSSEEKMWEQIAYFKKWILASQKKINVILYGPSSSGKSSLINTFNYVLNEKSNDSKCFVKCSWGTSGTDSLHIVKLNEYITFYDVPGLEQQNEDNNDHNRRKFWEGFCLMDYAMGQLEEGLKADDLKDRLNNKSKNVQINFVLFMSYLSGTGFLFELKTFLYWF